MINVVLDRIQKGEFVLVAEIGVNYYDIAVQMDITPMQAAKVMIDKAKDSGIHAVKFQTYKARTLAAKKSPYYWDITEEPTLSQYELFQKFDSFGKDEYQELSNYCEEQKVEFFSTPFDYESADYLDKMMNLYKISSSDLSNIPFIEYQAKKGKPILLSVGASNREEITAAVKAIRKYNNQILVLLHCVLEYPTPYEHANLNKIETLKKEYPNVIVGYSDHTKPKSGYDVIKTAYLKGALVVEKHYTLDKTLKGNDHYHAMDPQDAIGILRGIQEIQQICGSPELKSLPSEDKARINARRSIVTKGNVMKGELFSEKNLTYKRPGIGIPPTELHNVLGKKAKMDLVDDTILSLDMLE